MNSPIKVAGIDHVVLRCSDQARALDFYTRVLGLKEERRLEQIGLIQLRAGQGLVDLIPAGEPLTEAGRNVDHFCLGVETADVGEMVHYLREQSVKIIGEPSMRYGARGNGLSVYIRDPEGNVVELKQLPPTQ